MNVQTIALALMVLELNAGKSRSQLRLALWTLCIIMKLSDAGDREALLNKLRAGIRTVIAFQLALHMPHVTAQKLVKGLSNGEFGSVSSDRSAFWSYLYCRERLRLTGVYTEPCASACAFHILDRRPACALLAIALQRQSALIYDILFETS